MTTATPARQVVVRVLDDSLSRPDEHGQDRVCWLLSISSQTKRGEVAGLYEFLDYSEPFKHPSLFRVRKLGATVEVYDVTVEDWKPVACTCANATMRPEEFPCKHARGAQVVLHGKEGQ